jgi:hypothetical protein
MVNAPERAVVVPSVEVVVQGAARRQVLGDRGPLAARAQDVHEAVGHLAQVDRPLVAAALGGRDQWGDQRPFRVGQVTWVAQLATVVATTVLTRPHQRLPPDRNVAKGITTNSKHSRCSRMDTERIRSGRRAPWRFCLTSVIPSPGSQNLYIASPVSYRSEWPHYPRHDRFSSTRLGISPYKLRGDAPI